MGGVYGAVGAAGMQKIMQCSHHSVPHNTNALTASTSTLTHQHPCTYRLHLHTHSSTPMHPPTHSLTMQALYSLCTVLMHCTHYALYSCTVLTMHCTHYALYSCTVLTMHCTHYALYSLCTVLTMHCTHALYSRYTAGLHATPEPAHAF
jgi:hypothetical protein